MDMNEINPQIGESKNETFTHIYLADNDDTFFDPIDSVKTVCSFCNQAKEYDKFFFLDNCEHYFCFECIENYFCGKFGENENIIKCLDQHCEKYFNNHEIIEIVGKNKKLEKKMVEDILSCNLNNDKLNCPICLEEKDYFFNFFPENCDHYCCFECIFQYCQEKINNGIITIKCYHTDCRKNFEYYEIKKILEEDKVIDSKYENFLISSKLEEFDDITWCPFNNCNKPTPIIKSYDEKCIHCNQHFCGNCKNVTHDGYSCDLFKKYNGKIDFDTWLEMKGDAVKICPHCKYYGEKIDGCNDVTCIKCKKHFCWYCAQPLDDQHFDVKWKGCKNTNLGELSSNSNSDSDSD